MGLFDKMFGNKKKPEDEQNAKDVSRLKKTSTMMEKGQFWDILRRSLSESNDQDNQEDWLINELQKLPLDQIIGFRLRTDKLLYDTYTSEMWCAANIMNGGCSDDCFEYFRCWLISRGENVYKKARENPDSLIDEVVDGQDYDFEAFWYVTLEAFGRITRKEMDNYIDYDNFTTCEGHYPEIEFNWEEDKPETMKAICPKLFEKFCS